MAKQCSICGNKIGFADDSKRINDTNELVCMKCFRIISNYTDKMWQTEDKEEIAKLKEDAKANIYLNIAYQEGKNLLNNVLISETNKRLEYIKEMEPTQKTNENETAIDISPLSKDYYELCDNVILSTATTLEGYTVTKQLGIVYGETMFKPSIGKLINASIDNFIDSLAIFSSKEMTGSVYLIEEARKFAYIKMMREAIRRGANAIIAIDTDNTIGGECWYVSLYGTAVFVEKKES